MVQKLARFLWIDQEAKARRAILTEEITKKVSRLKRLDEASDHHAEAKVPGELLSKDLYFSGWNTRQFNFTTQSIDTRARSRRYRRPKEGCNAIRRNYLQRLAYR
jgi:hypothetical protein